LHAYRPHGAILLERTLAEKRTGAPATAVGGAFSGCAAFLNLKISNPKTVEILHF